MTEYAAAISLKETKPMAQQFLHTVKMLVVSLRYQHQKGYYIMKIVFTLQDKYIFKRKAI